MRPTTVSITSTAAPLSSALVPIDQYISPCNIAVGCIISGTVNYTVQHTFDNIFALNFDPATATWFNHPTLAAQIANADSNYAFPPRAIRVTKNSGTGTVSMTIVQSGRAQG
jgi:hypothetical protein